MMLTNILQFPINLSLLILMSQPWLVLFVTVINNIIIISVPPLLTIYFTNFCTEIKKRYIVKRFLPEKYCKNKNINILLWKDCYLRSYLSNSMFKKMKGKSSRNNYNLSEAVFSTLFSIYRIYTKQS